MAEETTEGQPGADWQAEHHKLQIRLDEELQRIADERAAHAKAIHDQCDRHEAALRGANKDHEQLVAELTAKHEAAMNDRDKERTACNRAHDEFVVKLIADHKADLEAQAASLRAAHQAEIATLKANVLVPAMRDMHARQQADLAAQHQAELAKLTG
ncbi:MAG: hypothetical protein KGL39_41625 [Patescibacteria group bacterium]|nr:hypothetical protein [Patescibacteria group bacterium]